MPEGESLSQQRKLVLEAQEAMASLGVKLRWTIEELSAAQKHRPDAG